MSSFQCPNIIKILNLIALSNSGNENGQKNQFFNDTALWSDLCSFWMELWQQTTSNIWELNRNVRSIMPQLIIRFKCHTHIWNLRWIEEMSISQKARCAWGETQKRETKNKKSEKKKLWLILSIKHGIKKFICMFHLAIVTMCELFLTCHCRLSKLRFFFHDPKHVCLKPQKQKNLKINNHLKMKRVSVREICNEFVVLIGINR